MNRGPFLVHGLDYHYGRAGDEKARYGLIVLPQGGYPDEEVERRLNLAAMKPRLVVSGGVTFVVSEWPTPGVRSISRLVIENDTSLTTFAGAVQDGFSPENVMKEHPHMPLSYLVTEDGEIIIPADSEFAKTLF